MAITTTIFKKLARNAIKDVQHVSQIHFVLVALKAYSSLIMVNALISLAWIRNTELLLLL